MTEPVLLNLKRRIHTENSFAPLADQNATRRKRSTVSGAFNTNNRRNTGITRPQKISMQRMRESFGVDGANRRHQRLGHNLATEQALITTWRMRRTKDAIVNLLKIQ
jgi:hypothetical protein